MTQRLGEKKLTLCRAITQTQYTSGWTRGGWAHGTAKCWAGSDHCDFVNYRTGEFSPYVRNGKVLPQPVEEKAPAWDLVLVD